MKSAKWFMMITLFGALLGPIEALTLVKQVLDRGVQERNLSDKQDNAVQQIKTTLADSSVMVDGVDNADACVGNNNRICVWEDSEKLTIEFRNPAETSTLVLDNIDLGDKEVNLSKYIQAYKTLLNESTKDNVEKKRIVMDKVEEILKTKGLTEISKPSDNVTRFAIPKPSNQSPIDVDWNEDTLTFRTNFFQNSVTLAMSNKIQLEEEAQKIANEVYDHYTRMIEFALSESQANQSAGSAGSDLTCSKVVADTVLSALLIKLPKAKQQTSGDTDDSKTVTITYMDKKIELSCATAQEGNELKLLILTVKLIEPFKPIVQPFFKQSLYNLIPVVQSFFEDIANLALRTYFTTSN